jgi:RHS repeat-associated protein
VLASYVNGQSDTYFKHANALGSWGLTTAHDGSVPQDQLYYPWGQTWTSGHYLFEPNWAAMSWYNAESNLFLTPARSYSSRLGRWMSPDPLGGDVTNPQSLNRYAYVPNNPASMIDPTGLDSEACQDPMYATSHAECSGDSLCEYFFMQCGNTPSGGWGEPGGGNTSIPGGWGNADNGGVTNCGQVTITIGGKTYPVGPPQCSSNSPWGLILPGGLTFAGSFWATVQLLGTQGIKPSPLDNSYNPYHGNDFNLRDSNQFCSAHVTLASNSGQVAGQPTTGAIHYDGVNPTYQAGISPEVDSQVQAWQLLLHGLLDVLPWKLGMLGAERLCY